MHMMAQKLISSLLIISFTSLLFLPVFSNPDAATIIYDSEESDPGPTVIEVPESKSNDSDKNSTVSSKPAASTFTFNYPDDDDVFKDLKTEDEVDPGSWRPIFEPEVFYFGDRKLEVAESEYYWGVLKMLTVVSSGEVRMMEEAAVEIEAAAKAGNPHAQSVMGFLHGVGQMVREKNRLKSFVYHYLAAMRGNMQSKMAIAYMYLQQEKYDKALKLYGELANLTLSTFLLTKHLTVNQPVLLHDGTKENKEALNKFRAEEDEDLQILKHLAEQGNGAAMYSVGLYHYTGHRGVKRDWSKAMSWFLKAADKGDSKAMEILGEIYAKGDGVERNYTKAFEWFELASRRHLSSAYNGLGYLYATGYGVERNYTKAKESFAKSGDVDGNYYLGQMYHKGIGVNKKDAGSAALYFAMAASAAQPEALYKLAQLYHCNCSGPFQNVSKAIKLYKYIAEQGPWSSLNRWAMEAYVKGDIGKAFVLFSRLAEMGYEVAQSNAVWILETYGDRNICVGQSGFCTDAERQQRADSLWFPLSM